MIRGLFLILLFVASLSNALAQKDSVPSYKAPSVKTFSVAEFESLDSFSLVSHNLDNFHNYLPAYTLGNSGLPFIPLTPFQLEDSRFQYRPDHTAWYRYSTSNLLFYNTRSPYSDLYYLTGSRREQIFKMTFTLNIRPAWNVAVDFLRIRSDGFYQRQNTNNNCFAISTNYTGPANRYRLLAGIAYNSIEFAENGGIVDSVIENSVQPLTDIQLNLARNSYQNRSIFTRHYFYTGRTKSDSLHKFLPQPSSFFGLYSSYSDHQTLYSDEQPLSGYYPNIYYDSVSTNDSAFHFRLKNELEWKRTDNRLRRGISDMAGFSAALRHEYSGLKQRSIDTMFQSVYARASLFNTYSLNRIYWNVGAEFGLAGYNRGDQRLSGTFKFIPDSSATIYLAASYARTEPDLIYQMYRSNHFVWDNDFEKTEVLNLAAGAVFPRLDLNVKAGYSAFINTVYFDNFAKPRQYSGSIPLFFASLSKDIELFNWHLDNSILYQQLSDSVVLRLPALNLQHSIYYENDLFKRAMRAQIGIQFRYTSEYYANAYMPATGQFYLQNEKKYGNYPYFDFFLNAQIRMVRVLFKIEHFNAGLSGTNYFLAPGYLSAGRTFKLGISWRFYD
jgi:hypothetical protein